MQTPEQELREQYASRGHAFLPSLVDETRLRPIQDAITRHLVTRGLSDGTSTEMGQLKYVAGREESVADVILSSTARMEALESIAQDGDVLAIVRHLIGCNEIFVHPIKWIRVVPPEGSILSYPAGVHQDYPELQGSLRQLTLWISIFPSTDDSGGLPLYDRPSRRGVLPLELADNPSGWTIPEHYLEGRTAHEFGSGDAVAFNTLTPHGGARNTGAGWRASLEVRFQPLDDPISEHNLQRPVLADSWDDHYRDWTQYAYYWRERHPTPIQFDDTWERWRDLEAIESGMRGDEIAIVALEIAAQFARSSVVRDVAKSLLADLTDSGG